jgi:hypothetical protein
MTGATGVPTSLFIALIIAASALFIAARALLFATTAVMSAATVVPIAAIPAARMVAVD